MYLRRQDFEKYGFTDGCPGCRDIATGRPGPSSGWAAHTSACRRRLQKDIQEAEPARWERHLKKRGDGGASVAAPSSPPAMGEPEEVAPPDQDEAEFDDAADLPPRPIGLLCAPFPGRRETLPAGRRAGFFPKVTSTTNERGNWAERRAEENAGELAV